VRPAGALVSYLSADATSLNTLRAGMSGNRIEFRDETVDGGMDPGSCTPGDINSSGYIIQTFCPVGGVQRVRIDLGEREDTATVAITVPATVLAGPGADQVTAGGEADELSGGEGNDVVDGGAGDDVISGDQGADALAGGPGADRIAARDGEADKVSCGEGNDTVEADTLDQLTSDCENVTRIETAGPGTNVDDGRPPQLEVGAPTLQRLGRSRKVHVYATSSERGAISASGALEVAGLALPIKTIDRQRVVHADVRDGVRLTVTDDGTRTGDGDPAPGGGIRGMSERAAAAGGRLEAGPRPGGGWSVVLAVPRGRR
jgi:Ca2+-binding RTX toxin-like protein